MSRLPRYIDSLNKFVKDRSVLHKSNKDELVCEVNKSDIIVPIIFLTIMNSQNKKKNISAQGYYAATSVLLINTIVNMFDVDDVDKVKRNLADFIIYINKSLSQNLENTKHLISSVEMTYVLNLYNNFLNFDNLFSPIMIKQGEGHLYESNDIGKYYLADHANSKELISQFNKLLKVDDDSYNMYIDKKYSQLAEIAFCVSWVIGCGDLAQINKLKRLSRQFAIFYKISVDFGNIERDLKIVSDSNNKSKNYVINYGIKKSYDNFLKYKQKFIEGCMVLDIFSTTIREILNYIDIKVDNVIDNSNPDLKSNFTPSSL